MDIEMGTRPTGWMKSGLGNGNDEVQGRDGEEYTYREEEGQADYREIPHEEEEGHEDVDQFRDLAQDENQYIDEQDDVLSPPSASASFLPKRLKRLSGSFALGRSMSQTQTQTSTTTQVNGVSKKKWGKMKASGDEREEMMPPSISIPPTSILKSSQRQNSFTSSTNSIPPGASSPTSTTAPLIRPKAAPAPARRRVPDTSNDLSKNWLTTTSAPVFSRAGLKSGGVVMPVKAPEERPTSVVEVEGWGEAVLVHRYGEMPTGGQGGLERSASEPSKLKRKESGLSRLGRALSLGVGRKKREETIGREETISEEKEG